MNQTVWALAYPMNVMGIFSNITLNKLPVSCSNAAVGGIGIAKKIDMPAFAIARAIPIADCGAMLVGILLFVPF